MAATVVTSCANSSIVEVLNLYNYEDWSLRVETYLIAEGLWDIVEATAKTPNNDETEYYRDWRMKNAKALHAIQNSCRTDVFGFICNIRMAKDAWETLAKRLKQKNNIVIKGMAATLVPSVMINLEALNKDNYEQWSFWVKTYLEAENLWEVVEGTREPPKREDGEAIFMAWRKNNARALHVITLFCGEDAKSCVRGNEMAKGAWNTLAKNFSPPDEITIIETPTGVNSEVDSDDHPNSNDGIEEEEIEGHQDLFDMVQDRRWEAVREYIERHPEAVRAKFGMTPLHYAVLLGTVDGVKLLLPLMKKRDLDIPNRYTGSTALSLAIQFLDTGDDRIEIVKCIVEKNKKLLLRAVRPDTNAIPLVYSLSLDKPEMADYLYSETRFEKLKKTDAAEIVSTGLRMKRLDIPLDLLRRFPDLIFAKDRSDECPLIELASTRAGLFPNVSQLGIWKRLIYRCIHIPPGKTRYVSVTVPEEDKDQGNQKQLIHKVCFFGRLFTNLRNLSGFGGIYQMKFLHDRTIQILKEIRILLQHDKLNPMQRKIVEKALFQAVERGHPPFIQRILYYNMFGNQSWFFASTNEHDKTLFQFAAEHRQDKIFDLISKYFDEKKIKEIIGRKDKFGNNMLHVVGKLSPLTKIDTIRGAALQMQYELQWFKKVERMADPKDLNCINSDGRTPREEFTWNHRTLVEAGEKSMKETATSSSALVAALIITIMFAAAVTVPGGINGDTGIPIYLHTKAFRTFIVADVISLCSSTTSVMVFLGILTSRFAEEDFLTSLPTKLIIGFLTLFLSILAMMIAFSSAILIMLPGKPSIAISSFVLAGFPIVSFLWTQFPYLLEIIASTYGSRLESWAHWIYYSSTTIPEGEL